MDGADGVVQKIGVRHHGDADLRGGDHVDVDPGVGQRLEERRRNARVGAHAGADQGQLADLLVVFDVFEADFGLGGAEGGQGVGAFDDGQREGDVRPAGAVRGDVLDDHVDVRVRIGDDLEDRGGLAGDVRNAHHGDLGFGTVVCNAGDDWLLQGNSLLSGDLVFGAGDDPGAFVLAE